MLKKIKLHIKFWPAYFAIFAILYGTGYSFVKSVTTISIAQKNSFAQTEFKETKAIQAEVFFKDPNTDSSIPRQLAINFEKDEENKHNHNGQDVLIADWSNYGYNFSQQATSLSYLTFQSILAKNSSVPLYILFHSWKSFIC